MEKRSLGQRPDVGPAHSQLMSSAPQPLRICGEISRRPVVKNVPGLSGGRGSSVDSLLPAFLTFLAGEAREIDEERKKILTSSSDLRTRAEEDIRTTEHGEDGGTRHKETVDPVTDPHSLRLQGCHLCSAACVCVSGWQPLSNNASFSYTSNKPAPSI